METSWAVIKSFANTYQISIQWIDLGTTYFLKAFQGSFEVECYLPKDGGTDQTDFETNYKPKGNIPILANTNIQSLAPYGSKTITINGVVKKLYSRFTGQQYSLVAGSNTLNFTATLAWAKLLGVEAVNCEALDYVDFKVYDNATGTYSGTPNLLLNQFSFALNLPKDFYQRMAQFDADIYAGMVIQITYYSQSAKNIGINFLFDEVK